MGSTESHRTLDRTTIPESTKVIVLKENSSRGKSYDVFLFSSLPICGSC